MREQSCFVLSYLTAPPLFGHETWYGRCALWLRWFPCALVIVRRHVSSSSPRAELTAGDVGVSSNLSVGRQPSSTWIVARISCTGDGSWRIEWFWPRTLFEPICFVRFDHDSLCHLNSVFRLPLKRGSIILDQTGTSSLAMCIKNVRGET